MGRPKKQTTTTTKETENSRDYNYKTNKEIILAEIAKLETYKKSDAIRINNIFLKYKKFLRENYETTDFSEPVMFLTRRSSEVEFYEKVTTGMFEYKHSDNTNRFIILTPHKQLKFGFGNKKFRGYFCHEDYPLPLPADPFLTADQMNAVIDQALRDVKEWKTKELRAKGDLLKILIYGVIGLAIAYIIYRLVVPTPPTVTEIKLVNDFTTNLSGIPQPQII